MFFLLLLAFCITFETAAPKTFKVVSKDWSDLFQATLPDKCRRLNGRLARIENAEKQKEVELFLKQLSGLHSVLVGGHRGSGYNTMKFYISYGKQLRYTNWKEGKPGSLKDKCIEVLTNTNNVFGKWNDVRCSKPWAALCEVDEFLDKQKDKEGLEGWPDKEGLEGWPDKEGLEGWPAEEEEDKISKGFLSKAPSGHLLGSAPAWFYVPAVTLLGRTWKDMVMLLAFSGFPILPKFQLVKFDLFPALNESKTWTKLVRQDSRNKN